MGCRTSRAILYWLMCGWGGFAAGQAKYTVHDLGTLGGDQSSATSINQTGQVAGASTTASGLFHAFRTAPNGSIDVLADDLGTLGGSSSQATGINASGQVVGLSADGTGTVRSFRTAPNAPINPATDDLGTLGGVRAGLPTIVHDIDDAGRAVGESVIVSGFFHAFRTAPNSAINPATDDLGDFGGRESDASSINQNGDIAGTMTPAEGGAYPSGILLRGGVITQLGQLGLGGVSALNNTDQVALNVNQQASFWNNGTLAQLAPLVSESQGINNAGQVVGYAPGSTGSYAFLYSQGAIVDLNTLIPSDSGWTLTSAAAINDAGQIAGNGQVGGQSHAFRLDPIASPADPIAALITTVDGLTPMPRLMALRKHLEQALAAVQAGDSQRARSFLNAFERLLNGHQTQLTADQEQQLMDAAEAAIMQL